MNPVWYEQAYLLTGLGPSIGLERSNIYHTIIPIGVNILSLFVIYMGYSVYIKREVHPFPQTGFFYKLSYNRWYIDAFYNPFIVKPVVALSKAYHGSIITLLMALLNLLPHGYHIPFKNNCLVRLLYN